MNHLLLAVSSALLIWQFVEVRQLTATLRAAPPPSHVVPNIRTPSPSPAYSAHKGEHKCRVTTTVKHGGRVNTSTTWRASLSEAIEACSTEHPCAIDCVGMSDLASQK